MGSGIGVHVRTEKDCQKLVVRELTSGKPALMMAIDSLNIAMSTYGGHSNNAVQVTRDAVLQSGMHGADTLLRSHGSTKAAQMKQPCSVTVAGLDDNQKLY